MLNYKIIIADNRDMSEVKSNSVQLAVTSPPYWHLDVFSKNGEAGSERDLSRYYKKEDFFNQIARTWAEVERVLKPGGVLVVQWEDYPVGSRLCGYPREICLCGDMVESVERSGLILISRWFVRKFGTGVAGQKFPYTLYDNLHSSYPRAIANVSYAFAFYKKAHIPLPKRELDFTRDEWKEWSDGLWDIPFIGGGLDISGGATFPVEFVKRCIKLYSNPGDLILEPFGGSGTTMRAAFQTGRSCTLYEALPRMLPLIKDKAMYGTQGLFSKIKWEVIVK